MQSLPRKKAVSHRSRILILLFAAFMYAVYPKSPTEAESSQNPVEAAPITIQPCKAELADNVPAISFSSARDIFLNQRHAVRSATTINRPSDMIGSIMFFGRTGKWIFVTDVEMRYDPTRELLAFSRVEGYLHNGQPVSIDKTSQLPSTFQVVKDWNDVGPVILRDIDGKMRRLQSLEFEVDIDGRLVKKELEINNTGGPCRAGGGITCTDFCFGDCRAGATDCHCDFDIIPRGFCMTAPGLNCGGNCREGTACGLAAPNPGALFCRCLPQRGPGPILDGPGKN